ncbi:MAG: hypothetical protein KatS3mg031_0858 [Chitinophagales bacterium]|nr:MAG: hypothetical protein KatS3mg031_0858 [Chitinophagales bacterium]
MVPHYRKLWFILTHVAFALLFFSAWWFYRERLHGDAGSYLLGVINRECFNVERSRYILMLSQWLPLAAVCLNLPLKLILISYSVGHVLFFYMLFLAGFFLLRQREDGVLYVLIQTLGVNFAYFAWPYGEVLYGLGLLLFLLFFLCRDQKLKWYHSGILLLLSFFLVGSHPLIYIVTIYALLYMIMLQVHIRKALLTLGLFTGVIAVKFIFFPDYDGGLLRERLQVGIRIFTLHEIYGMMQNHPVLSWCMGIVVAIQAVRKKWLWLILTAVSIFGIMLVIGQYFPLDGATQQYYLAFSGLVAVTLLLDFFHASQLHPRMRQVVLPAVVLAIAGVSYYPIYQTSCMFTKRVENMQTLIDYCRMHGMQRCIVNGYNYFKDTSSVWISADIYPEILLLSAEEGTPVELRIYERAWEMLEWHRQGIALREGPSDPARKSKRFPVNEAMQQELLNHIHQISEPVNPHFFPFSSSAYCLLNEEKENDWEYLKAHVSARVSRVENCAGWRQAAFRIHLYNTGPTPVYSGFSNNLHYVLLYQEGEREKIRLFPLMADVANGYAETLIVKGVNLCADCNWQILIQKGGKTVVIPERITHPGKNVLQGAPQYPGESGMLQKSGC